MVPTQTEIINEGKRLLPSYVHVDPPSDHKDEIQRKKLLLEKHRQILGKSPGKCALNPVEVFWKKVF